MTFFSGIKNKNFVEEELRATFQKLKYKYIYFFFNNAVSSHKLSAFQLGLSVEFPRSILYLIERELQQRM